MATFNSDFLYALDENGNSTNGKVVSQIANSAASSIESTNDGIIQVGETFTVTFSNPRTGVTYDGSYTYVGYETVVSGAIGQDSHGNYFLFTNDGSIPDGQNLNGFVAEEFPICYLVGTMIACPDGERAVETLAIGDLVLTFDGRAAPVRWIGHRKIRVASYARPEQVLPVRVIRDAVAPGIPHRDLLVSPDHAILIDGFLVAARQLINGSTIRQDWHGEFVEYYHIELETHDILIAEGLAAESYLDTGNRGFFINSTTPLVLHPDMLEHVNRPTREANSCAPFVSDEETVRPIWQRLNQRAKTLGLPSHTVNTTNDPALYVAIGELLIQPILRVDRMYTIIVPCGTTAIRIRSRDSAPTDSRPWLEDRRSLGVAVTKLTLHCGDQTEVFPIDTPDLKDGWWAVERDGTAMWRWTNGDALLPLPPSHELRILEISLGAVATYALASDVRSQAAA